MVIPKFTLPSKPTVQISMREATVADALDFCDVKTSMEEALTTAFLDRVQLSGDGFLGSKHWTADDRRLGLYWYWLHTTPDTTTQFKYDCGHCGKKHTINYDMLKLADGYKSMADGKAERSFKFKEELMSVRPLTGADMESLEQMRLAILPDTSPEDANKIRARIRLSSIIRILYFSSVGVDADRLVENEKKILALSMSDMDALVNIATEKLSEMEHGLETEFDASEGQIFLIIRTVCDGGETLLRVPFRSFVNIPVV